VERQKNLEVALSQIEKQFGKGSVMRMGEKGPMTIEAVSTGAPSLDLALGIGGLPRGRVTEIYGPESSGKSTLALHVVAEAQRTGGICAYVDAEHALDPVYAAAIGVDIDELLISQPDTGEQALEIADMLVRSGAIDVIAIDSVAALTPRAEIEGEMGDSHVGLQARLMSQALRKLTANLNRTRTIAIFINQLREKIGVLFGSPETTPGGRALKFYSSVRLDIRRIESIKDGPEVVGNRTRVKVVKNKCFAAGTKVFDPVSGLTNPIEDIVGKDAGSSVVAADKLGQLHVRPITQRFDQGEAECVGVKLRDGTELWVTPDHKVLTDTGWRQASEIGVGDRVARPRHFLSFGEAEPVPPDHARLLGYLIGDGYVGGKTPVSFINVKSELRDDVTRIVEELGCKTTLRGGGYELAISHRLGERNEVLDLCRWAGIYGHLAPQKRIPRSFFAADVAAEVVANLLFGIWESDGYVSREQTGGIRLGFTTTSEQLAHQIHWLLLRWGIGSAVQVYNAKNKRPSLVNGRRIQGKLPCLEVRISGTDNVTKFAESIPMWGPRGSVLVETLADPKLGKHRGSQRGYLPADVTEPMLAYLQGRGVTAVWAAALVGEGAGDPQGGLADALDSEFLRNVLSEEVWYDKVIAVLEREWRPIYDIEVDEHHTLVANDVIASNCAPPFKNAEFDIMYGKGISREGSLLDIAVDNGLVKKSGAWFTYDGEQLGQGRENAKQFLVDNPEVMVEISERIRAELGLEPTKTGDAADGANGTNGSDRPNGSNGTAKSANGRGDKMTAADDEPITLDG
jgi:recombination protein RecA